MLISFNNHKVSFLKLAHNSEHPGDPPSHPLIIESASNQTFLTREKVPATKVTENKKLSFESLSKFQEYLRQKLDMQKYSLKFDRRSMDFKKLEIIVKDVLSLPEFFNPYNEALKSLEDEYVEINRDTKDRIDEDMVVIEQIVLRDLEKAYRYDAYIMIL